MNNIQQANASQFPHMDTFGEVVRNYNDYYPGHTCFPVETPGTR